jgi:hypothetical protein
LASSSLSPSAFFAREPRRASVFSSWARSFIAPRSSSVNPSYVLPDFRVSAIAGFLPCQVLIGDDLMLREPPRRRLLRT